MKTSLHEVYHGQVRDLYNAETQQLKQLTEMETAASSDELKASISKARQQTQNHCARLKKICNAHGIPAEGEECKAMKGLISEAKHHMEETQTGPVLDAVMIASLNRFEHYEIAGYGVARAFAKALNLKDDADLLDETLDEVSSMDDTLTKIATGGFFGKGINDAAIA